MGFGKGLAATQPVSPNEWKRAMCRRPPRNFSVEVLPPQKRGNSYIYGFHIYTIGDDVASTTTRAPSLGKSMAPLNAYDIWRKWEDCLLLQESLEVAYVYAAREKRNGLAAGKGIKKNGVYIRSDQAASWDSLPFGPDPNDIAFDVHQYVPKISKKATLFTPSPDIVDNRYGDLQMMMHALFQDEELPTLVKDIKATNDFTHFFGVWRRDIELARKAQTPQMDAGGHRRQSLSNSILSAFLASPVSLSAKSPSPIKGKAPEKVQINLATSDSSLEDIIDTSRPGRPMDRKHEIRSMRARASSSGSHSSSSSPPTPVTMPPQLPPTTQQQPVIASQEVPIRFGHNPHVSGDRGSFILQSLPEDRELSSPPKPGLHGRHGSANGMHRNARVYVPSPPNSPEPSDPSPQSLIRYSRASLQSTHSSTTLKAAAYLDELDMDYNLPSPTPERGHLLRASVSSFASLVTNSSVDAVIPRDHRPLRPSANNTQRPAARWRETRMEYDTLSEGDSEPEEQDDLLDAYFQNFITPCDEVPMGFPETPTVESCRFSQEQSGTTVDSSSRYSERRISGSTVASGSTTSSDNATTLSIKAMHEDNVVMFRVPRSITYEQLRHAVYDKFIQTDNPTICETFAIAVVEQPLTESVPCGQPRADSMSSHGSAQPKGVALHFVSSQDRWDDVAATRCSKILLRIIGSRE